MSQGRLPQGLEHLAHYLETDRIAWNEVSLGTSLVVVANDIASQSPSSFELQVVETREEPNHLTTAWVELTDEGFSFVEGDRKTVLHLPAGTLMQAGVSCEHFPRTTGPMIYLGGIAAGRDFSFDEVMTPSGDIHDTVLVQRVSGLYSFMPSEPYSQPQGFEDYKKRIVAHKQADKSDYDKAVAELDANIDAEIDKLFPDEADREEMRRLFATFCVEGRLNLSGLMVYADEDGVLDGFIEALKHAIEEEFDMAPEGHRGMPILPSTDRGWKMMLGELGIKFPRQDHK